MNVSNKYASAYWNQELMGDLGSPELAEADTSSSISISLSIFPLQHIFSTWSLPFATDLVIPLTDQQWFSEAQKVSLPSWRFIHGI